MKQLLSGPDAFSSLLVLKKEIKFALVSHHTKYVYVKMPNAGDPFSAIEFLKIINYTAVV